MSDRIENAARWIEGQGRRAPTFAEKAARYARRRLFLQQRHTDYRRVFAHTADDDVRRSGARVLRDLATFAGIGTVLPPSASEAELRFRAGQQSVVLLILERMELDEAQLARLADMIREDH